MAKWGTQKRFGNYFIVPHLKDETSDKPAKGESVIDYLIVMSGPRKQAPPDAKRFVGKTYNEWLNADNWSC